METFTLQQRILDGASTIPGARLWPNGLGFDARGVAYGIAEFMPGDPWMAATPTNYGTGLTPSDANRARKGDA